MTTPRRRAALAAVLALVADTTGALRAQAAPQAPARWGVGLSIGSLHFSGGTTEAHTEDGVLRFTPYRPMPIGIRGEFGGAGVRVGLALEYSEPGLAGIAAAGPGQPAGGTIVLEHYLTTVALGASITTRIASLAGGGDREDERRVQGGHGAGGRERGRGSVRSGVGLLLEHWEVPGETSRRRAAGFALLGVEVPLFGRWVGSWYGVAGVGPSPFRGRELPAPYRPAALWRRGLTGGVAYRF